MLYRQPFVQDIVIDRTLGSTGVMTTTSYTPNPSLQDTGEGLGLDASSVQQLASANVEAGGTKVRLYAGRVVRGTLSGTRVIMKAYPQVRIAQLLLLALSADKHFDGVGSIARC